MGFKTVLGVKFNMKKLNQASRSGYTLDGWYTAGGKKVDETTRVRLGLCDVDESGKIIMTEPDQDNAVYQQLTLKARWIEQKSYAIKTTSKIPEGALITEYQTAPEGTLITITVNHTDGFKWEEKLVYDNSGNKIEVTTTGDNTCTFIMPASDVTLHEDPAGGDDDIVYHTVTFNGNNGLEVLLYLTDDI